MTKEVWVTIRSQQTMDGEKAEPIEIISAGEYYFRNEKHYVLYDEIMEGFEEITKNKIKITDDLIEITKSGVANVQMQFERGKKNNATYQTPYGPMLVGLSTHEMQVGVSGDAIHVDLEYTLDVNGDPMAECIISMLIQSKETVGLDF